MQRNTDSKQLNTYTYGYQRIIEKDLEYHFDYITDIYCKLYLYSAYYMYIIYCYLRHTHTYSK